jgi:hypothetical protein
MVYSNLTHNLQPETLNLAFKFGCFTTFNYQPSTFNLQSSLFLPTESVIVDDGSLHGGVFKLNPHSTTVNLEANLQVWMIDFERSTSNFHLSTCL